MNFNSLQYLVFLPTVIILYFLLPPRCRNYLLLAASYYFYMCWEPLYALLILTSTIVTYSCGRLLESFPRHKKAWVALSLIINLSILFFFKYFNFAAGIIGSLLGRVGLDFTSPGLNVLLPVGISFYTFQALGYTIDVYRGKLPAERNFIIYALFVSFFPQLVAGPIERSVNLLPQFREVHRFSESNIRSGLLPVLWGLFKKIVIADQLAVMVNAVYAAPEKYLPAQLICATVAFAFQIYCDFSAYSDIARGSAMMLGFRLMRNFDSPYFATSIQSFWRKWHISLTTWFRDYLYFPLGGSRCSSSRRYLNVLIVFTVSGLWHGAALTYIIWGLLNGIYQIAGLITAPLRDNIRRALHIGEGWPLTIWRYLFTFALVCLAWVFFRAESIGDAVNIIGSILGIMPSGLGQSFSLTALGLDAANLKMLLISLILLLTVDFLQPRIDLAKKIESNIWLSCLVWLILIAAILIFGSYGTGYDPQDFVYFQI